MCDPDCTFYGLSHSNRSLRAIHCPHRRHSLKELAFCIAFTLAEIPPECEEVEGEAEGDGPLDDGCRILVDVEEGAKGNGEDDEDEGDEGFDHVYASQGVDAKGLVEPSELQSVDVRCRKGAA